MRRRRRRGPSSSSSSLEHPVQLGLSSIWRRALLAVLLLCSALLPPRSAAAEESFVPHGLRRPPVVSGPIVYEVASQSDFEESLVALNTSAPNGDVQVVRFMKPLRLVQNVVRSSHGDHRARNLLVVTMVMVMMRMAGWWWG